MSTHYPIEPGAKERGGTSVEAAQALGGRKAALIRDQVVDALRRHGPMTADEVAVHCGLDILSVRPRCSELSDMQRIRKTPLRRQTALGSSAVVWELVSDA